MNLSAPDFPPPHTFEEQTHSLLFSILHTNKTSLHLNCTYQQPTAIHYNLRCTQRRRAAVDSNLLARRRPFSAFGRHVAGVPYCSFCVPKRTTSRIVRHHQSNQQILVATPLYLCKPDGTSPTSSRWYVCCVL